MAAYVRLTGTPYYIGAATDTKPASCPSGSRCYEHDTEKRYITYNGGTNWVAMATQTVTPSGWTPSAELAVGTNIVKASAGILHGFLVETGGTNDITVQFYNHASTATTPITPSIVVAGGDNYGGAMDADITCSVGIVCVHSGSGGIVTAYYK